ncbi:MAG: hypothetical protein KJO07_07725 [Deltaproteobacteria bacterium]|jgi:putative copper export protein|nr:hypothetical protein [Deltaproteobacteria bacterium]
MAWYLPLRWLHLVAAATWLGGMITLAVVVVALRKQGIEPDQLRAVARSFARLSWLAMVVLIATGAAQVALLHLPWNHPPLVWKLSAVGLTIAVAGLHQYMAGRLERRGQRVLEAAVLLTTLLAFAAAVRL